MVAIERAKLEWVTGGPGRHVRSNSHSGNEEKIFSIRPAETTDLLKRVTSPVLMSTIFPRTEARAGGGPLPESTVRLMSSKSAGSSGEKRHSP